MIYKEFPPMGPENILGIEYGDLVEYGSQYTPTTVMIYALDYNNGYIRCDNIMCSITDVRRIVKKKAIQSLK